MKRGYRRYQHFRTVAALELATLACALPVLPAHADAVPTGGAPWSRQSSAGARDRARVLFAQALDRHQQLLRVEAMELYEQALALWDNPDIRWNLALVLEDLGLYVRAHEQLEAALRWDAALGAERLREVQDRMRALEAQRLARIEADSTEPGADIELDGQPWFRGAGHRITLVSPGTHYIASTKPGYFPITVSTSVIAGRRYRVTLQMTADRPIETRRWPVWGPWGVAAAGLALVAVSIRFNLKSAGDWNRAEEMLKDGCAPVACAPARPRDYDRARSEKQLAVGMAIAGSTTVAVGLALVLINQPRVQRAEIAPSSIELVPTISQDRLGVSASVRF